jgi:hypothetical protein
MTRLFGKLLAPLSLLVLISACRESSAEDGEWRGTVETLASGAEHVRNPAAGIWGKDGGWSIVEVTRIGALESQGPEQFGDVRAVEIDLLGRIYVLDSQAREVRVFDADGGHVRSFGREGGGPGEFGQPSALLWGPDGNLWVVDQGNARFSVFDTTGTFVTSHPRPGGIMMLPWPGGFDTQGNLYDVAIGGGGPPERGGPRGPPQFSLARFDANLQPMDTFTIPQRRAETFELRSANRIMAMGVPFAPRMAWRLSPQGDIWMGMNDQYRLNRVTFAGDTVRIVEREFEPVEVTEADRAEALEGLGNFIEQGGIVDERKIPTVKPAYRQLSVDEDGYLWVRPSAAPDEEDVVFDIFDPEGRYLGRARSEVSIEPEAPFIVRGNTVVAVTEDELGVSYVVLARIEGRD